MYIYIYTYVLYMHNYIFISQVKWLSNTFFFFIGSMFKHAFHLSSQAPLCLALEEDGSLGSTKERKQPWQIVKAFKFLSYPAEK